MLRNVFMPYVLGCWRISPPQQLEFPFFPSSPIASVVSAVPNWPNCEHVLQQNSAKSVKKLPGDGFEGVTGVWIASPLKRLHVHVLAQRLSCGAYTCSHALFLLV